MGNSTPTNYLICDGTVYNISSYTKLANYFNTQFGSKNKFGGNGTTTFAVPNLKGEFLRGTGTNVHINQGSGGTVGQHQDATAIDYRTTDGVNINHINADSSYSDGQIRGYNAAGTTFSNSKWTTRPTNTSVLYCICYK